MLHQRPTRIFMLPLVTLFLIAPRINRCCVARNRSRKTAQRYIGSGRRPWVDRPGRVLGSKYYETPHIDQLAAKRNEIHQCNTPHVPSVRQREQPC